MDNTSLSVRVVGDEQFESAEVKVDWIIDDYREGDAGNT